jgi:hypothetical protein
MAGPTYGGTKISFDEDVFVFYGRDGTKPRRVELWRQLCSDTTSQTISCGGVNVTRHVMAHDLYPIASRYRFGISPPGYGWDCYRTYEYLLLGIIPIIDRTRFNESYDLFEGLPAIHIDKLHQAPQNVTRQRIVTAIEEYIGSPEFLNNSFPGWDRLFVGYWRREILIDAGRYDDMVRDHHGDRYYQAWQYVPSHTIGNDRFKADGNIH